MRSLSWLCVLFALTIFTLGCQDRGTPTSAPRGVGDSPTDMEVDVTETEDVTTTPESDELPLLDLDEPVTTDPQPEVFESEPSPVMEHPHPQSPHSVHPTPVEPAPIEPAPLDPAPAETPPAADDEPLPAPPAPMEIDLEAPAATAPES